MLFFFNDTATTALYTYCHTLSLHDALPIWLDRHCRGVAKPGRIGPMRASFGVHLPDHRASGFGGHSAHGAVAVGPDAGIEHPSVRAGGERLVPAIVYLRRQVGRSEEHTYEPQSLMRISYHVFCLKHHH